MENNVTLFEIPSDNIKEAQKFYNSVFGWTFKSWGEKYTLITATDSDEDTGMPLEPGSINGAIQKRGSKTQNVTVVVSVEDIDSTLEKIKLSGGKVILEKETVDDTGSYAQFEDAEGNRIGLFQVDM